MVREPDIEITSVTPFDKDGVEGGTPARRVTRSELGQGGLWLVAAALAVAASFARVFSVRTTFHSEGLAGAFFGYAYDGWGRETVESSQQLDGGPVIAGPRYGVLFCACASLM